MHLRVMTKLDVPAGLRLNTLAGWNQTAADWHRFLDTSSDGCFVAEIDGRVVGTATTISYQNRFAWIGMVLVDSDHRNRGIGTQLLNRTMEYLDHSKEPTMKLDATPQGQPLYAKLGFVREFELERWILRRPPGTVVAGAHSGYPPPTGAQFESILTADQSVFGADRSFLLRSLRDECPDFAMAIWSNGSPQGYAFGRRGLFADHLGPWMANSRLAAEQLLQQFLGRSSRETLIVDCLTANPVAVDLLRACGFVSSRPLTRMVRGPNAYPGKPASLFAILGPEFG